MTTTAKNIEAIMNIFSLISIGIFTPDTRTFTWLPDAENILDLNDLKIAGGKH